MPYIWAGGKKRRVFRPGKDKPNQKTKFGYSRVRKYPHTTKGRKEAYKKAKWLREVRNINAFVQEGTSRGRKIYHVWATIYEGGKR